MKLIIFVIVLFLYIIRCINAKGSREREPFFKRACTSMPQMTICKQSQTTKPIPQETRDYCNKYNTAYYHFCIPKVPPFAYDFCLGYFQYCPGAPPPGSTGPPNYNGWKFPNTGTSGLQSNGVQGVPSGGNPNSITPNVQRPNGPPSTSGFWPPRSGTAGLPSNGFPGQPLSGFGAQPQNTGPQFGGSVPGGIGIGSSLGTPFFGSNYGTNIVPTKGVATGTAINAAGIGVGASRGVDFSGVPFMSNVNSILGVPQGGGLGGSGIGAFSGGGFGRKKRQKF